MFIYSFTQYNSCIIVSVDEALKDVSLDKFLARHTSEDNVSFSEIVAEAEKKRRLKHAWLYEKVDEQLEVSLVVWSRSTLFQLKMWFSCIKTASFIGNM